MEFEDLTEGLTKGKGSKKFWLIGGGLAIILGAIGYMKAGGNQEQVTGPMYPDEEITPPGGISMDTFGQILEMNNLAMANMSDMFTQTNQNLEESKAVNSQILTELQEVKTNPVQTVPQAGQEQTPTAPTPAPTTTVDPMASAYASNLANKDTILASIQTQREANPNDTAYKKPVTPTTSTSKVVSDTANVKIPKGATLTEIAKANNTTVAKIVALNPGKISNPNKIKAGDTIRVK